MVYGIYGLDLFWYVLSYDVSHVI
ncbi:hypothetical protein F383_26337 [Gossypium arboreum]|uniref:Uncharacterized protein n=1 Tax=Gossypium arboreum TaxID=29729 RepID=A0A0B0P899_GOSAR|nr:hypothetical protein F383_26337 [Gossypium arboreum]